MNIPRKHLETCEKGFSLRNEVEEYEEDEDIYEISYFAIYFVRRSAQISIEAH